MARVGPTHFVTSDNKQPLGNDTDGAATLLPILPLPLLGAVSAEF